jgi:hypothetical protein
MVSHFARLLAVAAVLGLALPAFAQVSPAPSLINFQGRLANASGTPVPDGSNYTVTVSLWDAATGGNPKWSQTLNNVTVKSGVFSALLTADTAGLFNGASLWLQVQVGSDPAMTPRQQIGSVPFALKANSVPDASIGNGQLASDTGSLNKVSGGAVTSSGGNVGIGTSSPGARLELMNGGLRLNNTTDSKKWELNYVTVGHYFYIDEFGAARRLVIANGGNVGIGTSAPAAPLHISSPVGFPATALVSSSNTSGTWLQLANTSAGGRGWSLVSTGPGNGEGAGNLLWYDHGGSGGRMLLTSTGWLGVNNTAPVQTLDVNGGLNVRGGVIQSGGGAAIASTADLGLYSQQSGNWERFVTNDGEFHWFSDGGGGTNPIMSLTPSGELTANVVTVLGGSDVAEPYHVAEDGGVKPVPGMVVVMDSEHVGQMKVASRAYDPTVGGILSGANGVKPGLTLRQKGTIADGELPVASVGRVWCCADADADGPITTGTLLTTSDTPGYAMRVGDYNRANGCIIGKAMSGLASGKGLVLVLVSLK